jgi:C4-dicarboxylate-specific signal transduction histidine kinase
MVTIKKYTALLLITFLYFNQAMGQATSSAQNPVFNGTIEEQFDVLIKNSFPYENFKNIRDNLPRFRKNTLDSLHALQNQIAEQKTTTENQKTTIDSLQTSLSSMKETISQRDNISFLGMSLEKGTYNLIVWSIIVILIILLSFFIQRYKSNFRVAKESKDAADEIREEFEQHRKKAMEREQKLKRDLQDELNKSGR